LAVAQGLPAHLGEELLGTAREAFTQALTLAATISAIATLAAAVLVAVQLRRAQLGGEAELAAQAAVNSTTRPA
jgi:hypothetical protein